MIRALESDNDLVDFVRRCIRKTMDRKPHLLEAILTNFRQIFINLDPALDIDFLAEINDRLIEMNSQRTQKGSKAIFELDSWNSYLSWPHFNAAKRNWLKKLALMNSQEVKMAKSMESS